MEKKKIFTRYTFLIFFIVALFIALTFRLADIQIVQGESIRKQAEDKSIVKVDDDAPRGEILDRNGIKLAKNKQIYTIFLMKPQDKQAQNNLMLVIERLVDILNKDNEKINDDFIINIKPQAGGKYSFEFEDNSDDKTNPAIKWKENHGMTGDELKYNAEQTFYYLKNKYKINPVGKGHNNIPFIRQMMAVMINIQDMGYMAYIPVDIAYVKKETAFEIMEKGLYLPGVDYKIKSVREYPFGQLAATIIGSLRKIPPDKDKKAEYSDKGYNVNSDLIGRDGIEAYAESYLRGEKGGSTVKVDALGRVVEEVGQTASTPGNNVVLTIDKNLQAFTESTLDKIMSQLRSGELKVRNGPYPNATRGAAVVLDVKTGEVLAMASRPGGYDPNVMAKTGGFPESVRKILYPINSEYPDVDPERIPKPTYNYATRGAVPPGSTFKMISAITGLETGYITPSTKIICVGPYRVIPSFTGNCWIWNEYNGSHGKQTVIGALKNSCNYFFFDVGRMVGLKNLAKYAKMFGLSNDPTGIEIFEETGNVANEAEIKANAKAYALRMVLKDIATPGFDPAIGAFAPTDKQKQVITEVISSYAGNSPALNTQLKNAGINSYKIRRRILDASLDVYKEVNKPGQVLDAAIGQGNDRFTPLQMANYVAAIANGGTRYRPHLIKEIVEADGTVYKNIQPEVLQKITLKPTTLPTVIAGMDAVTGEGGTAGNVFKNVSVKTAGKTGTATASGDRDDYSWFVGFAPTDNPQIAIAVTIHEGGGYGASNVARDIIDYYFKNISTASKPDK